MINYNELVPHDSFVGRYLVYMQSQETASAFDWWCALWCLSAACARTTYVNRPRAPVYLNMFVILVGDSGVVRKTTSVHIAARVVRSMLAHYPDIGMLDAKLTPEKLDLILHTRTATHDSAQMCIAVPELAVFMGTERYIAHMPTLLTDLYDCPDERFGGGTIARGAVQQRNVWIHFLSASTPIWLLKTVNPNVVEGGFTSRCYFVNASEPKHRVAWPMAPDVSLYKDLLEDVRIIAAEARSRPPVQVEQSALGAFTNWYTNRQRSIDPYKQSFEAREDAHVLRVAALISINDGQWEIREQHINTAIALITDLKESSGNIFELATARSKYATALDALRMQLISSGMDPVPRGRLFMRCKSRMDHQEFMELLDVLQELGAIQRFEVSGPRGRPTDLIRGTRKLLQHGLGDQVLARFG